jgi:hypothetical protein
MDIGKLTWSRLGAALAVVVAVVVIAATAVRSKAQTPASAQGENAAGSGDRLSPTRLLSGPSIYETGRVGVAPEAEPTAIVPEEEMGSRREKRVKRAVAGVDTGPIQPPPGVVDSPTLEREIRTRFSEVESCRVDVARIRQVLPAEITAEKLMLRWTILPTGETTRTAVVATAPVDLDVMDCVKGVMSRWHFTSPVGGPVEIERAFAFHQLLR